jgi:hypothetical protein
MRIVENMLAVAFFRREHLHRRADRRCGRKRQEAFGSYESKRKKRRFNSRRWTRKALSPPGQYRERVSLVA